MTNWYQIALDQLGWREVTLWYRMIDGYSFNHMEIGHAKGSEPTPRSAAQKKAWSGGRWSKKLWFATPVESLHVLPEQRQQ